MKIRFNKRENNTRYIPIRILSYVYNDKMRPIYNNMYVEKRETATGIVCVCVCVEDNATGEPSSAPAGFGTEECCAVVVERNEWGQSSILWVYRLIIQRVIVSRSREIHEEKNFLSLIYININIIPSTALYIKSRGYLSTHYTRVCLYRYRLGTLYIIILITG